MTRRCPTCGQALPEQEPTIRTAEQLVAAMRQPPPPSLDRKVHRRDRTRDVYEGYKNGKTPTGEFYLTYGNGATIARAAVEDAIRRGLVKLSYPDINTGSWSLPEQAAINHKLWHEHQERENVRRAQRNG